MNHRFRLSCSFASFVLSLLVFCPWSSRAAEAPIDIDRSGKLSAIPISISGFSPDVVAVLRTDLTFMGFTNASPSQAKYLVTGTSSGQLAGRVIEVGNKQQVFGRSYSGNNIRAQAHAFSDDVATHLRPGVPPIAQTKIAFKVETGGRRSEIYISDYDGYNAQPVTRDNDLVVAPSWIGRSGLVYTSYKLGNPFVFSHNLSSGARAAVARYPGSNISPAASPDGARVAIISSKGGSPDLYVSNIDGSGLKTLTQTAAEESSPCWSPDGRLICYVSKSSGVNALYVISPEGGSPRRLQTAGVPNPTEPSWSPDGKQIAFTCLMRDFHICVVPAQGGRAEVLVEGEDPSWAPNSRALIFCKGPDHRKILSLLDVPTKQVKDIARILESNSQPSWAK